MAKLPLQKLFCMLHTNVLVDACNVCSKCVLYVCSKCVTFKWMCVGRMPLTKKNWTGARQEQNRYRICSNKNRGVYFFKGHGKPRVYLRYSGVARGGA